jgi:hypothetical protein
LDANSSPDVTINSLLSLLGGQPENLAQENRNTFPRGKRNHFFAKDSISLLMGEAFIWWRRNAITISNSWIGDL